jgi:hypothetical protein
VLPVGGRFATNATVPKTLIDVPAEPVLPVAPVGPVGPVDPVLPVEPVAPVTDAPVGPVGPCFNVNSNIAADDVPTFVTEGVPAGPVVKVLPTATVAAAPVGPVPPVAPCGPVCPLTFPVYVHALEIHAYKLPFVKI